MRIGILGAGVSGLACGVELLRRGHDVEVYEKTGRIGGLARSFEFGGFQCDLAAHRLYSRDPEVLGRWEGLVPLDVHRRRSHLFMRGKYLQDPINPIEFVLKSPFREGLAMVLGYLRKARLPEDCFENWVLNHYGRGLYDLIMRPYTEKLFGVLGTHIAKEWGQRKLRTSGLWETIKRKSRLYFKTFYYPRRGGLAAMMDGMARQLQGRIHYNVDLQAFHQHGNRLTGMTYVHGGRRRRVGFDHLVSTIPLTKLGRMLGQNVDLQFVPLTLVYLALRQPQVTDDHWIYFPQQDIAINRMSEIKHFTSEPTPPDRTVVCAEVTGATGGEQRRVIRDLVRCGLVREQDVVDALAVVSPYSYPLYLAGYPQVLAAADAAFARFTNLERVGRNATFTHMEIDNCFRAAIDLARRLPVGSEPARVRVASPRAGTADDLSVVTAP